jgi:uncharacterized membrane protein HdeD (DUF308 family)
MKEGNMLEVLTRYWWAFIVRGILAIALGVMVYAWPAMSVAALIIVFGIYAFVDGVFLLVKAIGGWKARDDRWLLLFEGLLGIGIGVITFIAPGVTAVGLLFYIAAWSLTTGILEIVGAIRLRKEIEGEVWWILTGIVSILFAVFLMVFPGAGILGLVWLLGIYAIVFGILLIALGIRIRVYRPAK